MCSADWRHKSPDHQRYKFFSLFTSANRINLHVHGVVCYYEPKKVQNKNTKTRKREIDYTSHVKRDLYLFMKREKMLSQLESNIWHCLSLIERCELWLESCGFLSHPLIEFSETLNIDVTIDIESSVDYFTSCGLFLRSKFYYQIFYNFIPNVNLLSNDSEN